MALHLGTRNESSDGDGYPVFDFGLAGMSQAIFVELDTMMSPPLQKAIDTAPNADAQQVAEQALDEARHGWEKLAYAVATGVIGHLLGNLEIQGIETHGDVDDVAISGSTGSANPSSHTHGAGTLHGTQSNVTFEQSNPGTGLIA